jgi:hypothetical protein
MALLPDQQIRRIIMEKGHLYCAVGARNSPILTGVTHLIQVTLHPYLGCCTRVPRIADPMDQPRRLWFPLGTPFGRTNWSWAVRPCALVGSQVRCQAT